jgi:hypothetical protein
MGVLSFVEFLFVYLLFIIYLQNKREGRAGDQDQLVV